METVPNKDDLRSLIQTVVTETLDERESRQAENQGPLAYWEPDAAALIGVKPHALRDARYRGELVGSEVGKRIVYLHDELMEFLHRQKV